jgi:dTDP-4-amino-4,6-dideoxygalactose transaminase
MSPKVRCIIVSHLHGGIADMPAICRIAAEHGATVIEDACQAQGASVYGRIAGTWGDVGVLSFGGSKLLTAGRGGALLMRDAMVHQRAKIFCDWGNDAFPMSELQAAVLPPQLEKLAARNRTRRVNVRRLFAALADTKALTPVANPTDAGQAAYYKLAWLYDPSQCGGASRESFVAAVRAEGVALDAGFHGFTRRPDRRCRKVGDLEHAQQAADSTVLLHHPVLLLSPETIDRVAAALQKVAAGLAE